MYCAEGTARAEVIDYCILEGLDINAVDSVRNIVCKIHTLVLNEFLRRWDKMHYFMRLLVVIYKQLSIFC